MGHLCHIIANTFNVLLKVCAYVAADSKIQPVGNYGYITGKQHIVKKTYGFLSSISTRYFITLVNTSNYKISTQTYYAYHTSHTCKVHMYQYFTDVQHSTVVENTSFFWLDVRTNR